MRSMSPQPTSRQLTIENIVALALAVAVIATCIVKGWFDAICMMMQHNEIYQVDEMVGSGVVLLIAFVFMFARRDRQLRAEAKLLKRREAEHSAAARRDFLTGAANRLALAEWLAARRGEAVTFITLDLDDFKTINDSFGHAAGDAVLVEVAARLRRALDGSSDALVVRMGGDEFGCLIAQKQGVDEDALLTAIVDGLRPPIGYRGAELHVSASIGTAACGNGRRSLDDLLQDADGAMYRAKQEKRRPPIDAPPLPRPFAVRR